ETSADDVARDAPVADADRAGSLVLGPKLADERAEIDVGGQQRLGLPVSLVPLAEQLRGGVQVIVGKRDNLESGHRRGTIPLTRCRRRPSREPSSSLTTVPSVTPSSSSSTGTTSRTGHILRYRRSWRRAKASPRTRCSASRTCSSSC